jgi:competence CoiA-like predicted nuclease
MLQALVNGVLLSPQKGLKGNCQFCDSEMISKCGDSKVHHWAHKIKECDDWHTGKETEWHINWKKSIGIEFAEKRIIKNDQFHIADILINDRLGKADLIIEFQNSPLSQSEIIERETFYGDRLIWVLNGTNLGNKLFINRDFRKYKFNDMFFQFNIDSDYFNGKSGKWECAYVIKLTYLFPQFKFEEFLLREGFLKDRESFERIERIKRSGLKPYEDFPYRIFYFPTNTSDYGHWLDFQDSFEIKMNQECDRLNKENEKISLKQGIIKDVTYNWKHAKTDFNVAKRPVYLDLNENEILQLENGSVRKGNGGKLIRKDRFLGRIKERIDTLRKDYNEIVFQE